MIVAYQIMASSPHFSSCGSLTFLHSTQTSNGVKCLQFSQIFSVLPVTILHSVTATVGQLGCNIPYGRDHIVLWTKQSIHETFCLIAESSCAISLLEAPWIVIHAFIMYYPSTQLTLGMGRYWASTSGIGRASVQCCMLTGWTPCTQIQQKLQFHLFIIWCTVQTAQVRPRMDD